MIEKLNDETYLDLSMEELENRLEMEAATPAVVCSPEYCNTWNCGDKCSGIYGS